MGAKVAEKEEGPKYYSVPLHLYAPNDRVTENLYYLYQGKYVLYRRKNSEWTTDDEKALKEFGAKELYIQCADSRAHFQFVESNLDRILHQEKTSTQKKASVLYECATGIAKNVFESPSSTETFTRSKKVVDHTIGLLAKDGDAFFQMISLSSHDYYTYTHCVNVMTFTIGLLSALGIKDQKIIRESAVGAFLHDIGKSKVPLEILNKPGPLNEEEWKVMKKHPEYGVEILKNQAVPQMGKDIILQHHERMNGTGYPYGLKQSEILEVSQVVSVCDAYDAMTTNRVYQKALAPLQAFKIITGQMMGKHFDSKIVETFIQLLNFDRRR